MLPRLLLLLATPACAVVVPPAKLVVLGPGNSAVQLIASKRAKRAGYAVTHFARDDLEFRCQELMYGRDWRSIDPSDRAEVAPFTSSRMAPALASADGLVLCAEAGGLRLTSILDKVARRVKRIVLLSAIGGSRGVGGNAMMGEPAQILECEAEARRLADAEGVELAVVRVGVLKGGGAPGGAPDGGDGPAPSAFFGLDAEAYYATLQVGGYPTLDAECTRTYDRCTLGAAAALGATLEPRSALVRSRTRGATGAIPDEVSRINAAGALLACLRSPAPLDITISAKAAAAAPTDAEWDQMLAQLCQA